MNPLDRKSAPGEVSAVTPTDGEREPLVYLDQNILGYMVDGRIQLKGRFTAVFSDEHFAEMNRGDKAVSLLEALRMLGARRLEQETENWYPTGKMMLMTYEDPESAWKRYREAIAEVPLDDFIHSELLASFYGGSDSETLKSLPARLREQLERLFEQAGIAGAEAHDQSNEAAANLQNLVDDWNEKHRPIDEQRTIMGLGKGVASGFEDSPNPVQAILEAITSRAGEIPAQMLASFPFGDVERTVTENRFGAVVGIHSMLNHLGYRPDRKLSKASQIPNILSDGRHMAYGSFCEVVLSADRRFRAKASAIYTFLGLPIKVPDFEFNGEGDTLAISINP